MASVIPTVFIVDPDPSVRARLERLLRRAGWQPEPYASARDFVVHAHRHRPGCLLMHVAGPELDALNEMQQIAADRRETAVIAMSSHGSIPLIVQALKAGAVDFLLKPLADDVVLVAVEQAIGRSRLILQQEAELVELRSRYDSLSQREQQVMARIVAGSLNKQVGAALGISEITVKAHRGRVMRKMGANSLADLVRMALRLRLPSPALMSESPPTLSRGGGSLSGYGSRSLQPVRIRPAARHQPDAEPVVRC